MTPPQENTQSIQQLAAEVLEIEARAILKLRERLDESFTRAVNSFSPAPDAWL